jgi:peptide/nickel transport system permease protein
MSTEFMRTGAVVGKRLAVLPAVLLLVAVMTWGLAWASPFDPAEAYVAGLVGPGQSNQALEEAYRQAWGLDEPVPAQFVNWLGNLLTGDLGVSRMIPGQEVSAIIGSRLGASVLVATALALVLAGSLIMGVLAARFRDSAFDWFVRTVSYTNAFAPSFWVALLAIYFFSVWLGWLPATGAADLRSAGGSTVDLAHLVLPAVTLALTQHGVFTLYVRSTVLEMMREDHVRFARAQGASETSALFRHALPNSLVPYVTLIGTHIPELIGGSVLIETVFAWPGLGSLTVAAARAVDLPLLLAIVLAGAVLVVFGNLVADLLYRVVDPRVREARA